MSKTKAVIKPNVSNPVRDQALHLILQWYGYGDVAKLSALQFNRFFDKNTVKGKQYDYRIIFKDKESSYNKAIRFGLSAVKNVGGVAIEAILSARK